MKNVCICLSMRSFTFRSAVVLLIILLSFCAPASAMCDQRTDDFQSRIKLLEEQEREYESAINFWNEILAQLRTGKYIVWPFSDEFHGFYGLPVTREQFNKFLNYELLTGKITPNRAANFIDRCNFMTRELQAQLPGEIRSLEVGREKVKDQRSALLNERARTRESQSPDNRTGSCTWQECPCQWLANTCTGGAKYGTSKESCKEWGGTYWHDSGHCGRGSCSFSKVCPWPGHYCCK